VHLNDVAVGPEEGGVDVEDGLDVILSGRQIPDAVKREAESQFVDNRRLAGLEPFDIHPKKRLGRPPADGGMPRLILEIVRKKEKDTAVQGSFLEPLWKRDLEAKAGGDRTKPGKGRSEKGNQDGE
jgi:hypothetical protein